MRNTLFLGISDGVIGKTCFNCKKPIYADEPSSRYISFGVEKWIHTEINYCKYVYNNDEITKQYQTVRKLVECSEIQHSIGNIEESERLFEKAKNTKIHKIIMVIKSKL